jgi:hypothetical protein
MNNYTKYRDSAIQEDKPTPALFDVFKPYLYLALLVTYLVIGVFWVKNYMAIKKTESLCAKIESQVRVIQIRDYVLFVSNNGTDTLYITNNGTTFSPPTYTGPMYGVYGKATTPCSSIVFNESK